MNHDAIQLLQKGFHVTLGATTALAEALQDPLKREENLAHLRLEFNELTQVWEQKGQATEEEARNLVNQFVAQQGPSGSAPTSSGYNPPTTATNPVVNPLLQTQLQDLIAELATLRTELAQLREQDR